MSERILHSACRPSRRAAHWPRGLAAAGVALALAAIAKPTLALTLDEVRGSVGVGYSRLFISDAPSGSLTTTAGVSIPVYGRFSAGIGLGYNLLGSRTVPRGSLVAGVDYSMFEAGLFVHWVPEHLGPVGRISGAIEMMSCHAELSTSGGGAGFSDLAVDHVSPGAGLDVTLISRSPKLVRVGLEVGGRLAILPGDDWALATTRLVFHY